MKALDMQKFPLTPRPHVHRPNHYSLRLRTKGRPRPDNSHLRITTKVPNSS